MKKLGLIDLIEGLQILHAFTDFDQVSLCSCVHAPRDAWLRVPLPAPVSDTSSHARLKELGWVESPDGYAWYLGSEQKMDPDLEEEE